MRFPLRFYLAAAVLFAGLLSACGTDEPEANAASECPEAAAPFEAAGLPVPEDFYVSGGACPEAGAIGRGLEDALVVSPPRHEELVEALESGEIREDQDPRTYPKELREATGLAERLTPEANRRLDRIYGEAPGG